MSDDYIGGQPREYVRMRMEQLMKPIEQQIQMTDDRSELLMLASAMLVACKDIFDSEIGEAGRNKMFKEFTE
jgi:hypothetical protein